MIQRLQSLYLFAIIIICAVLCGGSVINVRETVDGVTKDYIMNFLYFKVYENGVLAQSDMQYVLILILSLTMLWTFKILFGFKNRQQQLKDARINFIFMGVLFAALFSTASLRIPNLHFSSLSANSVFGLALFIFMFYLNFRAIMLIRKDERMVKDADRIR